MDAIISPCGRYRYTLTRNIPCVLRWVRPCLFVALNPSTADASIDDPTIRRLVGFATSWQCTSLTVVNLFALRATDPAELARAGSEAIGPDNDRYIWDQLEAHSNGGVIVAAWGAHRMAQFRPGVKAWLREAGAQCLGLTKGGEPRHPLYLRKDTALQPYA